VQEPVSRQSQASPATATVPAKPAPAPAASPAVPSPQPAASRPLPAVARLNKPRVLDRVSANVASARAAAAAGPTSGPAPLEETQPIPSFLKLVKC